MSLGLALPGFRVYSGPSFRILFRVRVVNVVLGRGSLFNNNYAGAIGVHVGLAPAVRPLHDVFVVSASAGVIL